MLRLASSFRFRSPLGTLATFFAAVAGVACTTEAPRSHIALQEVFVSEQQYSTAQQLRLSALRALCADSGIPNCPTGEIVLAAQSPEGSLAVATADRQLLLLDSLGRSIRLVGRTGAGPGEYRSLMAVGFTPDGSLHVFDVWGARLLRFGREGGFDTSVVTRPSLELQEAAFVQGELLTLLVPPGKNIGDTVGARVAKMDEAGNTAETGLRIPDRAVLVEGADLMPAPAPFAPRALWAVSSGGAVYFTLGDAFEIDRYDPDGTTGRRILGAHGAREVTEDELAEALDARVRGVSDQRMRAAIMATTPRGADGKVRHPMFTALVSGASEMLFAREASLHGSARWNVFGKDGALLGFFDLPEGARLLLVDGERLLIAGHTVVKGQSTAWFSLEF
jgi:hypothetical protein